MHNNTTLRYQVSELNTKQNEQTMTKFRGQASRKTELDVNSIVSSISESCLVKTDVTCFSSGHFEDIKLLENPQNNHMTMSYLCWAEIIGILHMSQRRYLPLPL